MSSPNFQAHAAANSISYRSHKIAGKENVSLLIAPPIESDVLSKQCAFHAAFSKLSGKLNDPHSANALISVLDDHFPIDCQISEQHADHVLRVFKKSFYRAKVLDPIAFLDKNGHVVDIKKMFTCNRPADVRFMEEHASIPMSELHPGLSSQPLVSAMYIIALTQTTSFSSKNPSSVPHQSCSPIASIAVPQDAIASTTSIPHHGDHAASLLNSNQHDAGFV